MDLRPMDLQPIRAGSVSELAYERIRALIIDGQFAPNARLNQGELADSFGISRTSVREALHRLTSESMVEFHRHRGFFVAAPLQLDGVVDRLEVRMLMEGEMARLAASRRTEDDIAALRRVVHEEARARSPHEAHDLSREFHMLLASATQNPELVRILDSLWTVDVGRRLLARRGTSPTWQAEDVAEHEAIIGAIAAGDGDRAARLAHQHVAAAHGHWSQKAAAGDAPA